MDPKEERDLVRKSRSGSSGHFEPLVRLHEAEAVRIARAILGDADAARDATQDAFVKAYRSLSSFDTRRRFRPWFLQILRNQCRDVLRSRKVRRRLEAMEASLATRVVNDTDRGQERREAREIVRRGLAEIEDMHREILIMKEFEDLSYQEIADSLGIPEGTVASRLYHARRALRQALERLGVSYP